MKAIFIDLDGTLMNDQKQVTPATREALMRAKAEGHIIIISTGRSFVYIEKLNKELGDVCRYTVSSTGSLVYDLGEKRILAVNPVPTQTAINLCRLGDPNIIWLLHCTNGLFSTQEHTAEQNEVDQFITTPINKFLQTQTVCALCVASPNFDAIKDMEPAILKIPGIHITNRHKHLVDESYPRRGLCYYDITAKNVSKGHGTMTLRNLLGLEKSDCIAIGDDNNDLSMFKECGIKVAMGNAISSVKKAADYITDDNNCDGVANFLNHLLEKK